MDFLIFYDFLYVKSGFVLCTSPVTPCRIRTSTPLRSLSLETGTLADTSVTRVTQGGRLQVSDHVHDVDQSHDIFDDCLDQDQGRRG